MTATMVRLVPTRVHYPDARALSQHARLSQLRASEVDELSAALVVPR